MTKVNHVKTGSTRKTLRNLFLAICGVAVALTLAQMAQAQTNTFPSSGNAGIGTTTPTYPLDVLSSAQWAARFKKTDATHGGIIIDAATGFNPSVGLSVNGTIKWYMNNNVANGDTLQFWESNGQYPRFTLTQAGNVGIGTSSPTGTLQVEGSGQNNTLRIVSSNPTSGGFVGQNTQAGAQAVVLVENNRGGFASYGGFLYGGSTNASGNLFGVSRADKLFLFADGASNLGMAIGTLSNQPLILGTNGAERVRVTATGNVGIGTTSPGGRLHVFGSSGNDSYIGEYGNTLNFLYNNPSDSVSGWVNFDGYQGGQSKFRDFSIGNGKRSAIAFFQGSSGNVGIGNTSPTEKLHVTGNGKFTGNLTVDGTINAKYQDVAEWVPTSEQLVAGTVVVLDSTKSNQVISSTTGYDTRVAGVISAQPGIALGESGEGKVLVATTGRVRVKVDATHVPIRIGDLLVTSDIPGLAMKSEPIRIGGRQMHSPGTLIGKALEPLARGKGEILVLLSLQ